METGDDGSSGRHVRCHQVVTKTQMVVKRDFLYIETHCYFATLLLHRELLIETGIFLVFGIEVHVLCNRLNIRAHNFVV